MVYPAVVVLGYPLRVLLTAVEARSGAEAVTRARTLAGIGAERSFRMTDAFDVGEIDRLLESVGQVLALSPGELESFWVDVFFDDLLRRWPMWFQRSRNARELLELQPEIHNSFARAMTDPRARQAVVEKFQLEARPDLTVVHYRSPHRLCRVYGLMARKVLAHYGDVADIREPRCQHQGDRECEIHIRWEASA